MKLSIGMFKTAERFGTIRSISAHDFSSVFHTFVKFILLINSCQEKLR